MAVTVVGRGPVGRVDRGIHALEAHGIARPDRYVVAVAVGGRGLRRWGGCPFLQLVCLNSVIGSVCLNIQGYRCDVDRRLVDPRVVTGKPDAEHIGRRAAFMRDDGPAVTGVFEFRLQVRRHGRQIAAVERHGAARVGSNTERKHTDQRRPARGRERDALDFVAGAGVLVARDGRVDAGLRAGRDRDVELAAEHDAVGREARASQGVARLVAQRRGCHNLVPAVRQIGIDGLAVAAAVEHQYGLPLIAGRRAEAGAGLVHAVVNLVDATGHQNAVLDQRPIIWIDDAMRARDAGVQHFFVEGDDDIAHFLPDGGVVFEPFAGGQEEIGGFRAGRVGAFLETAEVEVRVRGGAIVRQCVFVPYDHVVAARGHADRCVVLAGPRSAIRLGGIAGGRGGKCLFLRAVHYRDDVDRHTKRCA